MFLFGACGLYLIANGDVIAGISVMYLSFLMDKCDGEVARFTHTTTAKGIYLDELYHTLINPLIFATIGYSLRQQSECLLIGLTGSYLYLFLRSEYKIIYSVASKRGIRLGPRVDLLTQDWVAKILRVSAMFIAEDLILIVCVFSYQLHKLSFFLWAYLILMTCLAVANVLYSYSIVSVW
jgi:phosphatidylglycerophosphate synthase